MFAIANTDYDWYTMLKEKGITDEVNFWTPTPWNIRKLKTGDKFYFRLKAPHSKIAGYGLFSYYKNMTADEAWRMFKERNGVKNKQQLIDRSNWYISKNSHTFDVSDNPIIGCIVLTNVFFYKEDNYFYPEEYGLSFRYNIVTFKYFESDDIDGIIREEDAEEFPEGKLLYRIHRLRERNTRIIKKAKQLAQNNGLKCEICGFSFYEKYGELGKDFIEAHHTVPISEYEEEFTTKIEDISLVCSNCHRMLHRKRPWLTKEDLKKLICS